MTYTFTATSGCTTTAIGDYQITGGWSGGSSGTVTLPGQYFTTPGYVTFPPAKAPTSLTPAQIAFLLTEHCFIPMEGTEYCLFCYALDVYRGKIEHLFVITEE